MATLAGTKKSLINKGLFVLFTFGVMTFACCSGPPADSGFKLEAGFKNPPESAKPRIWWHWMNGNITKEGIKADIEWMKRAGIGGFQNFDADISTPQIVDKRLIYMTPEWKDAFLYSAKLADSLGLEMSIAGSPGWSESGGPWVTPTQAMKKIVWSKAEIDGGKTFKGALPLPPNTTGPFQNIPLHSNESAQKKLPQFYSDAAVIAYRLPEQDLSPAALNPEVSSSSGKIDHGILSDGDMSKSFFLPASKKETEAWIQLRFKEKVSVSSMTLLFTEYGLNEAGFDGPRISRKLEVSDNGKTYREVFEFPTTGFMERTFSFPRVNGQYYRIAFNTPPGKEQFRGKTNNDSYKKIQAGFNIFKVALHTVSRVNRFEDKAGFTSAAGLYSLASSTIPSEDAIKKSEVVDLTSLMKPDGTLEWDPPAGRWAVLRFGYSLTGHQNAPASPEATGLEVDKLNKSYVKSYFNTYLDQYTSCTDGLMGKRGLHYVITDSWEAGVQNWTDSMVTEFSKRRGYDMRPWMPVLTGQIVESSEASDRFLWDFRKTISDLTSENHYDQLTDILNERGMERYTESHEAGRAFIADGMEVKRKAAIPMSALWTPNKPGGTISTGYMADVREAASVAHLYGQSFIAVEAMTSYGSPWAWSPESLKPTADMILACGANRIVQSVSVHSPSEDKLPGLSLGPFGLWTNRHDTWAEMANPWMTYLARSSYMLQQGRNVADILYYYGEDNNITALFSDKLPDIPKGYNYDFVNSDALINIMSVQDGMLVTPAGTSYKILALDQNARYMPLKVLNKVSSMVKSGAVIVGEKPLGTPSLSDDQNEFIRLRNELWPDGKGISSIGKGKIFSGFSITEVLNSLNIMPDFICSAENEPEILFVHHNVNGIDLYWINNRNHRLENILADFRTDGRIPEIWHPETGLIEKASFKRKNGRTQVQMKLEADDAVFVVFRQKSGKSSDELKLPAETRLATIEGPWDLAFQPGRGAPEHVNLDNLIPWNENTNTGIKYFSGTGTYSKKIQVPAEWLKNDSQKWIDLGIVKDLAEVVINGKSAGITWKTPFRLNISGLLKEGENTLEIRVTNLWVNRLIGDQQPGNKQKITYTSEPFYSARSSLLQSGLSGPVEILSISK